MKGKHLLLLCIGAVMAMGFAACGGEDSAHPHSVERVEAKEATCAAEGNVTYWYCAECDQAWKDESLTVTLEKADTVIAKLAHEYENACDTNCVNCGEATNEEAEHTVVHTEAVAASCHKEGNVEYWSCSDCGTVWKDEALTQAVELKDVKVAALGGNTVHMDAVAAGCHYEGNIEYWFCSDCNKVWKDAALTQSIAKEDVVISATGGETTYFAAVAPECHENGNIEHWVCYECEQVWQDEGLTQLTNIKNVVVGALGGEVVHVEGVEATDVTDGNLEYWYCEDCDKVWTDEALTQLTDLESVVISKSGCELVHIEAVAPSCHYNGNIEYWVCYDCEQVWQDEAMTQLTNIKNVIIPATGGEVVHVEAVEPACHYEGNIEYWYCEDCMQVWQDEALTQVTNIKNVVLPATGGEVVHVEAVEPACHYNGNIEHWVCYECEQVWQDEALTQVTNIKNVIIPATGGEVTHFEAKDAACHYEGNIEYWVCYECEQVWQDEALTQVTNIKNVVLPELGGEVIHVAAKEATCAEEGNIEYWYCESCMQVWQDEARTQLTNIKNVKLGGGAHSYFYACDKTCMVCYEETNPEATHTVVHVEAKDATCSEFGNVEYWYCEVCASAWTDEAQTQQTNMKSVKVPMVAHSYVYPCDKVCQECYEETNPNATHTVVHVEAKSATCTETGNVEYWYCSDCGSAWTDEAQTQVTNMMSVNIPANGHSYFNACDKVCEACYEITRPEATHTVVHVDAVTPDCTAEGNVEYWYCSDCGSAWTDEAQTQQTNMKSVTLPMTDCSGYEADYVCDVCGNVVAPAADSTLTIAQATALGVAVGDNKYTEDKYYVTAIVKDVYNTTYGNMYLVDENGTEFTVYGTYSADGSSRYDAMTTKPVKGDTVTVYSEIGNYNGSAQMKNGWITAHTVHTCSTFTEAECLKASVCTVCGAVNSAALGHIDENSDNTCDRCSESLAVDPENQSWKLVTDASQLKAGSKVVIAAVASNVAIGDTQNSNNRADETITKEGDSITFDDSVIEVLTLCDGNKDGTFAFQVEEGGYLYAASSSKNYLRTENTLSDNSSWTITIAVDGTATVVAQGTNTRNTMQYNKTSSLFAVYSSASQQAICIYIYA